MPNGLGTRWREGLKRPSREASDRANNQGPAGMQPATNDVKPRVTFSYPTHKVSVKVSRRSVEAMANRPTSKIVILSGTYWCSPRTKPYGQQNWGHILVPMW